MIGLAVLALTITTSSYFIWESDTSADLDMTTSTVGSADFEMQTVSVSYVDLFSNPISEVPVDQEFRVRVEFTFRNNGPDDIRAVITVTLSAPAGCEFVFPSSGSETFDTGDPVVSGGTIMGFAELKVRCTSGGPKQFSATVSVTPREPATDPEPSNNSDSAQGPSINVTGGSPTPTPTLGPTPTSTPTPTPFIPDETTATPPPTASPTPLQVPFFSLTANNPSGLDPADILRPGAIPIITCTQLGLDCDGVDAEGPPVQDDLDGLTFANEKQGGQIVFFSTDSQSAGIEGSGTHSQSNLALQCHEEGNEYSEFPIGVGGDNIVFFPAPALGLHATACPDQPDDDDDMDALAWGGFAPGPNDDIYFSLAPGSPTLALLGASPADILITRIGESPSIYRSAASLGLQLTDNIDGVCLFRELDVEVFLISLSRGSPTLATISGSPDDLLIDGSEVALPIVFKHGSKYGLLATDNLDAVKCQEPTLPEPPPGESVVWGDSNCSEEVDPVDSLFVLRSDAGLPTNTGDCPEMGQDIEVLNASPHIWGDIDCSGEVTPVDSLKVLRFDAGLGVTQPVGCPPIGSEVLLVEQPIPGRESARCRDPRTPGAEIRASRIRLDWPTCVR